MCMPRWQHTAMPKGSFNSFHYAHADSLLKRCEVRVACAKDDDERLFGFSILEGQQIHCVYVSKAYWRCGIAKALLAGMDIPNSTFRLWPNTMHGSSTEWMRAKLEGLSYLPHWLEVTNVGRKEA